MLPLQEELWHFFLSDNKPGSLPYWRGNKNKCYNNNMDYKVCNHVMLMPMLMPMLSFYNKIHTWGQNFFFCWKRYVTEQVRKKLSWKWKPYLLRLRLIPAKEKQSARILKNATISLLWYYYGNTVILIPFWVRFKHVHSFCRCRCG